MPTSEAIKGVITTKDQVLRFEQSGFSRAEMRALNRQVVEMRRSAAAKPLAGILVEQTIALTLNNALLKKTIENARFLRAAREIGEMITRMG